MKAVAGAYRFGTVLPDGSLDYGVYPIKEARFDMPDYGMSEFRLKEAAFGDPTGEFYRTCHFLNGAMPRKARDTMNDWYHRITEKKIDLIKCEFDGWMYVRYCSRGQWFSWGKAKDFPDRDLMSYADKGRYFALYETYFGWYRPKDGDRLHEQELLAERNNALKDWAW